jgi:hypothetical protein
MTTHCSTRRLDAVASTVFGFGGCRNTRRFALLACQELEYRRYGVGNNEALLVQLQPLQGGCLPMSQLVLHTTVVHANLYAAVHKPSRLVQLDQETQMTFCTAV